MNNEPLATPFHDSAINKAEEEMKKAFDSYVIIGYISSDDMEREQITYRYGGGLIRSVGLAHEFLETKTARHIADTVEDRK